MEPEQLYSIILFATAVAVMNAPVKFMSSMARMSSTVYLIAGVTLFYDFRVSITISGLEWELRDMPKEQMLVKCLATPQRYQRGKNDSEKTYCWIAAATMRPSIREWVFAMVEVRRSSSEVSRTSIWR